MEQRNLIVAIVLSVAILLGFQFFYEMPRMEKQRALQAQLQKQEQVVTPPAPGQPGAQPGTTQPAVGQAPAGAAPVAAAAVPEAPRVKIVSPRVNGSISLAGGRIDDVVLTDYRETTEPRSPNIHLLSPSGTANPYFAEFGWVAGANGVTLPGPDTRWQASGIELTPAKPVVLTWDNGQGLKFEREYKIDRDFMITVSDRVTNSGQQTTTLFPYALISRAGTPQIQGFYILHEGLIGVLKGTLKELTYKDIAEKAKIEEESTGGWVGITDKYWLVALAPDGQAKIKARFAHSIANRADKYQVDVLGEGVAVEPGKTSQSTIRLFAGAKQARLLDNYATDLKIERFDLAIDFGWFYFLTKPIFYLLDYFTSFFGNVGLAILGLTVLIKLLMFPLANKSYRAMNRMKALQPEMLRIREQYGDDRQRMNQSMMELYKKEKVNPAAGCLPIVVQIPVFFALYKVLFVTIEMRHAPFYGWIKDLSAPDPTTIFNLFGLIPWQPPELLIIGVWPLIMGATMWVQQKLNPQPADPIQAKVFMFLPIMFTVMLASFPAGLVIYWAWNNLLSILQQWVLMRSAPADKPKT